MMNENFMEKTLTFQFVAHLPVFDVFERSLISTFWNRLYVCVFRTRVSAQQ